LSVVQDPNNEKYIFPQTVGDANHIVHTFVKKKEKNNKKYDIVRALKCLGTVVGSFVEQRIFLCHSARFLSNVSEQETMKMTPHE
jgi:hypothetical protein